jgi:hypothetical protein
MKDFIHLITLLRRRNIYQIFLKTDTVRNGTVKEAANNQTLISITLHWDLTVWLKKNQLKNQKRRRKQKKMKNLKKLRLNKNRRI